MQWVHLKDRCVNDLPDMCLRLMVKGRQSRVQGLKAFGTNKEMPLDHINRSTE